jgi:hypothetical protein
MARTAVTDVMVKTIFDTSIDTTPFITTSTLIVDEELLSEGMTDARLTQINLYLAAHFACIRDPLAESQKMGDAQEKYQGKTGMGLEATFYGQQVKLLDSSGILAKLDKLGATIETVRPDYTRTIRRRDGSWY